MHWFSLAVTNDHKICGSKPTQTFYDTVLEGGRLIRVSLANMKVCIGLTSFPETLEKAFFFPGLF